MITKSPKTLLTAASLARRADVPQMKIVRAIKAGLVAPDYRAGRLALFSCEAGHIAELTRILNPNHPTPPEVLA